MVVVWVKIGFGEVRLGPLLLLSLGVSVIRVKTECKSVIFYFFIFLTFLLIFAS